MTESPPSARIVLVRHGPSAHVDTRGSIDRDALQRWRDAYDAAGILADARPPEALVRLASDATHVIASDLPRAIRSAERLAPERAIEVSDLLRESPLAIPRWPTRLPLMAWAMLIHIAWSYRIGRGTDESESDRARAAAAADWLIGMVGDRSTAVVVTHGVFRRLLARHLSLRGWASDGGRRSYAHWSAWSFTPPR